jgi:hypothetical protein
MISNHVGGGQTVPHLSEGNRARGTRGLQVAAAVHIFFYLQIMVFNHSLILKFLRRLILTVNILERPLACRTTTSEIMASQAGESLKHGSSLEDLTIDNLTSHVISMSTQIDDARVKYLTTKLIQHLHDFVRDVQLRTDEWEAAWQFLTKVPFLFA